MFLWCCMTCTVLVCPKNHWNQNQRLCKRLHSTVKCQLKTTLKFRPPHYKTTSWQTGFQVFSTFQNEILLTIKTSFCETQLWSYYWNLMGFAVLWISGSQRGVVTIHDGSPVVQLKILDTALFPQDVAEYPPYPVGTGAYILAMSANSALYTVSTGARVPLHVNAISLP